MWLFVGILIGLGLAWYLAAKGYISQPPREQPAAADPGQSEAPIAEAPGGDADAEPSRKSRYDFFTVLPEMEVVVPEQELANPPEPDVASTPSGSGDSYQLQVGSFRSGSDADQLKAKLALMGVVAQVQTVTVNDTTWHRVRVGPVQGARRADEIRRQLQQGGIDSLVMKNP